MGVEYLNPGIPVLDRSDSPCFLLAFRLGFLETNCKLNYVFSVTGNTPKDTVMKVKFLRGCC